jgi:hypothetical protein
VLAKALVLAGRAITLSVWTIPAFFWHDAAIASVVALADRVLHRPRWMWAIYATLVVWAAINVPIARALSSPLTVPMLRAAGLPLLDSVTVYLTAGTLIRIATVMCAGVMMPTLFRRVPRGSRRAIGVAAGALVLVGPFALSRLDTLGLHRNAVTAIAATVWPRVSARAAIADWRVSTAPAQEAIDLTSMRGAAAGRNVVFIALESTAAQYLALYGSADDPMPTVTALARDGFVVDPAYAVYPESIKGLFAVLCSRDPAFDVTAESHAASGCASLPAAIARAGYRTALFHSGRFVYLGMQPVVDAAGFDVAEDAGAIGGQVESSFGVDETATVRRLLSWISNGDRRPFFVAYLPIAGHHPYATTSRGPFDDASELGAYKNALHEADGAVAALVAGLRAAGHGDDTLFVFYGDHGEAFGQHPGNAGHSLFIYDENVRVPLVVAAPGRAWRSAPPAARVDRVTSVIDIAPTVLDLLGLPLDPGHDGTSLLAPGSRAALFFTDYALGWLGLRDGCWKYIYGMDARRSQLYDVCRDPAETVNLAGGERACRDLPRSCRALERRPTRRDHRAVTAALASRYAAEMPAETLLSKRKPTSAESRANSLRRFSTRIDFFACSSVSPRAIDASICDLIDSSSRTSSFA